MPTLTKTYDNAVFELTQGELNERLPLITSGLVYYMPLDGESLAVKASDSSKVAPNSIQGESISYREGFGVGDVATNLAYLIPTWNAGGGLTGTQDTYKNQYGRNSSHVIITSTGVGWGNYYTTGNISVSPSTTYTISIMVKYRYNWPNKNLIYVRDYAAGGTQNSETGYYDHNNQVYAEMGWYRAYATFTTSSNTSYISVQGYEYNANEIWVEDIKIEQRASMTPYTPDTRSVKPFVSFGPLGGLKTYTVIGKFNPYTPFDGTYTKTSNQSMLFRAVDASSAGDMIYRYFVFGGSAPFLDPTGSFGTAHVHQFYDVSIGYDAWYVMRKTGTSFSFKLFQDSWKAEHLATLASNNQLDYFQLGTATDVPWNGTHRDVAIYNRLLSDDEIELVVRGRSILRPDGSMGCLLDENDNPNLWPNADLTTTAYAVGSNGTVVLKTDSYGTYHEMTISGTTFTQRGYAIATESGATYVFSGWFWVSTGNSLFSSVAIEGAASGGGYVPMPSTTEVWTYCSNTCVSDGNILCMIYPTAGGGGSGTVKWRNMSLRKLSQDNVSLNSYSELVVGEFME